MTTIQLRRGTSQEWVAANPILAPGEVGVELDTNKFKLGDGVTYWSVAEYYVPAPDVMAAIQAEMASHLAAANPHPQYGSASGLPDHIAAADPHPQYATDSDLAAHVAHADPHPVYATDVDLNTHISAPDAHPQYATDADLADHIAAPDPHNQYATDSDLLAHRTDPDAHPQYASDEEFNAYVKAADVIYEKKSALLKEAAWWVDAGAAKNDRLVDLSGNGRDAIFGSDAARPILLPWDGEDYFWTPDAYAHGFQYAGSPVFGGAGEMVVDAVVKDIDATFMAILYGSTVLVGTPRVSINGPNIYVSYFKDTAAGEVQVYWPAASVQDGNWHTVKVIYSADGAGATVFFDGVTQGYKAWPDGLIRSQVPENSQANVGYGGAFKRVTVTIGGVKVLDLDPSKVNDSYTIFDDYVTNTLGWGIIRSPQGMKAAIVDRPLLLFGGAQIASIHEFWSTDGIPPALSVILAYRVFNEVCTQPMSYAAHLGLYTGNPHWQHVYIGDRAADATSPIVVAGDDSRHIVLPIQPTGGFVGTRAVVHSSSQGVGYQNGVRIKTDTDALVPVIKTETMLIIGSNPNAKTFLLPGQNPSNIEFIAGAIFDRALTDDEIAEVSKELAGTSEPSYLTATDVGNTNLLTPNQASIEENLEGLNLTNVCSVSRVTTDSLHGFASLKAKADPGLTASMGFGTPRDPSHPKRIKVTPGVTYTGTASAKTPTARVALQVIFWTAAGAVASSMYGASVTCAQWTKIPSVTLTAPSNAAYASLELYCPGPYPEGTEVLADKLGFWQGVGGDWAMPGDYIKNQDVALPTIGNLLTPNQASIETDTTGWVIDGALDPLVHYTLDAVHGAACLQINHPTQAWGVWNTGNPTSGIRVEPGQPYTMSAMVKNLYGTRSYRLGLNWHSRDGALISQDFSPIVQTSNTWWTRLTHVVKAPAGAMFAVMMLRPGVTGTYGDASLWDQVGFWKGAGGDWVMPGTPIPNLGYQITHPNTDDVLVQVWDSVKARWQTVHYDSGFRNLIGSPSVAGAVLPGSITGWRRDLQGIGRTALQIKRVNNMVTCVGWELYPPAGSTGFWGTSGPNNGGIVPVPDGFSAAVTSFVGWGQPVGICVWNSTNYPSQNYISSMFAYYGNATVQGWASANLLTVATQPPANVTADWQIAFALQWETEDPIPTSLPGVLARPAPAFILPGQI